MSASTGISFTLSDALKEAEKMDNHFDSWVKQSIEINANMRKAFSAKSTGEVAAGLRDLKGLIDGIAGKTISPKTNSEDVQKLGDALDRVAKAVDFLANENVELFDTKGLYDTTKGLAEATIEAEALSKAIKKLKDSYKVLLAANIEGDSEGAIQAREVARQMLEKRGVKEWNGIGLDNLSEEQLRAASRYERERIEEELRAEIEREAIAKKELNYAKMTQDEKAQYIQKKLNEVLKAEQQQIDKIRAEYKRLNQELRNTVISRSAIEEVEQGKHMMSSEKETYDALVNYEHDLRQKIQQMEVDHLEQISDLKISYAVKDAKNIADIIKKRQYSATDALTMASNARTGEEMEKAKEAVKSALMTVDKDDLKTIDELNKAYLNLRASIEKLTKAQKNEQTLQPSIRNEYRRVLKELDDLHAAQERLRNTDAYKGLLSTQDAQETADAMAAFDAREKDLLDKKVKYEQEAGNLLDEVVRENAKRQADIRLQEFEKAQKELEAREKKYGSITSFEADQVIWDNSHADNVRKSQKAIEELTEARDKLNKYDSDYEKTLDSLNKEIKKHEEFIESVTKAEEYREKQQKKQRETYKGAMDYSKQAKSINDLQKAIKYLEAARNAEDLSTEEGKKRYRELTNELKRQQKAFDGLSGSVKNNGRHLLNIGDQLARKFALVFSVSQIQGYIHKLMEVRGEFELQQRSLQAILQDQDKANEIWQKTVDLAVRSPFRVKELVTYTKQLAAYRVEADKLYDTNKMLADVSAGLGVDMNRLILAFGQVKAANFLRGTELRQFTEAGIPMLDELANHFNEMNGTALKSADIFEMISKRMIGFEDVEAVFKRLTSEGGRFYQMQEIQAETLQGQISNLRDSLDLMLNEIGISSEEVIKKNVERVRILVENWQRAADILKFLVASFAAYKLNALLADKALLKFAISQGYATAGSSKLAKGLGLTRASFVKFFTTIKTGLATSGWLLAVTAILDVIMRTIQWNRNLNASVAEVNQRYYEQSVVVNKVTKAYNELIEAEKEENADAQEIFEDKKKQLEELLGIAKERSLDIEVNLKEIKPEQIDAIVTQIREQIIYAADWGKEFGIAMAKGLGAAQGRFLGINFFGDNLKTDIEQLNNAIADIGGATKNQLDAATSELEARYDELSNVAQQAYDELKKGKKDEETEQQWLERRVSLIYKAQDAEEFYGRAGVRNAKAIKDAEETREKIARRREEVESEITKVVQRQLDAYGVEDFADLTPETQRLVQYEIDEAFSEMQISGELKRWAAAFASEKFKIQYVIETPKPDDKSLLAWQDAYNKYISSFSNDTKTVIKSITNVETEREALAKQVRETKEIYDNIVKAYETGAKAYSKEEYEQAKKIAEEARKAQIWLEGTSQDKGKDLVAEKLKERISLIKEMNKEYEKLRKDMSKEEAEAEVRKAYASTAKDLDLDISKMDFDDDGTIFSLKSLKKDAQYKAKTYAFEIQKALDGYEVELKIETKTEDRKKLKEKFDEMLDMVNLSKEMKDLGISESIAEAFDIEYISLDKMKSSLKKAKNMFDSLGEDGTTLYEEYLEKIGDMEDKSAKERMKTYVKYLQEGMSERVKLKIEELRKLKEVEESDEFTLEQKERIKLGVSKEAKKEQDKQEWEDFKGMEMYTMMFEDLEFLGTKALGVLQDKLEALKGSLSDLDASEVKEIIGQINKIEDVMIGRNPFKYMKALKDELKNMKSEEEYQIDLINSQKQEEEAQSVIDAIHTVQQAKVELGEVEAYKSVDKETLQIYLQMSAEAIKQGRTLEDIVKEKEAIVKDSQKEGQVASQGLNTYKKTRKALQEQHDAWGEIGGKIDEVFEASKELMTTLGVSTDSVAMSLVESAQGMGQLITSAVQFGLQMEIVGYQSNMALGVIGWILIAIQAIAKILSAIFSAKDKSLQKKVEDNLAEVERLQEAYDKLEDSIDDAWDTASIRQYNAELKATTQSMIDAQKAAIAAQSKRKGANKEGTDAYNELQDMKKEREELETQLEDSLANSFSKVTDGILDGVHDAAREFTDAWWDAFVETGDGLSGLEENFNEMFLNLAKNQAAMQITGAFADRWKKDLEKYINADDTELTKDEARAWAQKVRDTFPELSDALEGYLGAFKDMATEVEGAGLSALQKGIQGVTEQTAQVIEALLNSMRFYVADSNSELKDQTRCLRDIHNLLSDAMSNSSRAFSTKLV